MPNLFQFQGWLGSGVVSVLDLGTEWPWVQIAATTLSRYSLRQTVHTHRASVHQAVKLAAALLSVARITAGLVESNDSLPPGLWLASPAGWLPKTGISPETIRSVIEYTYSSSLSCVVLKGIFWDNWHNVLQARHLSYYPTTSNGKKSRYCNCDNRTISPWQVF